MSFPLTNPSNGWRNIFRPDNTYFMIILPRWCKRDPSTHFPTDGRAFVSLHKIHTKAQRKKENPPFGLPWLHLCIPPNRSSILHGGEGAVSSGQTGNSWPGAHEGCSHDAYWSLFALCLAHRVKSQAYPSCRASLHNNSAAQPNRHHIKAPSLYTSRLKRKKKTE